ncbi:MAG: DNA-directed RNA polymerase subunit alpha [Armatimonadetes bacterium]|nr:DNA-directed RNA polymerase subunit alpha [Armatimonadota bacterium]
MIEGLNPQVKIMEMTATYGKFAIEPLERGFGHTLGNALRRVLLAKIEGAAITDVRIEGALHEFDTLEGVLEDNTEIIFNLRELAVKVHKPDGAPAEDEPLEWVLRIDAEGEGKVTGADVICPPDVEIVNPSLHIATLTSPKARLYAEMFVELGKGYLPVEARPRGRRGADVIPVDAAFSPIRRCAYHVEPTRVGAMTDLDRLTLELWGDGTMAPDEALRDAARQLQQYLTVFVGVEAEAVVSEEMEPEEAMRARVLEYPIEDVDFTVRTYNCLKKSNINTLGELIERTADELLAIRNFGQRSLEEVIAKLAQFDLTLREAEEASEGED